MATQEKSKVCRSETVRRLIGAAAKTLSSSALNQQARTNLCRDIQALGIKLTSAESFFQNRDCGCASQSDPDELRYACTSEALAAEVFLAVDCFRDKLQRRKQRLTMALEQCQIAERLAIHPQQSARAFELHANLVAKIADVDSLCKTLPPIRGRALTCLKQASGPAESPLLSRVTE